MPYNTPSFAEFANSGMSDLVLHSITNRNRDLSSIVRTGFPGPSDAVFVTFGLNQLTALNVFVGSSFRLSPRPLPRSGTLVRYPWHFFYPTSESDAIGYHFTHADMSISAKLYCNSRNMDSDLQYSSTARNGRGGLIASGIYGGSLTRKVGVLRGVSNYAVITLAESHRYAKSSMQTRTSSRSAHVANDGISDSHLICGELVQATLPVLRALSDAEAPASLESTWESWLYAVNMPSFLSNSDVTL